MDLVIWKTANGGYEVAVTARVRISRVRLRKCGELLLGNRFSLNMKGNVYRSYAKSIISYENETWMFK